MTFKLQFDQKQKFCAHYLFFMIKPEKYKIEMSLDNMLWITAMDWVRVPDWWFLPFWFHIGVYDP
jgi:hypothetical protein